METLPAETGVVDEEEAGDGGNEFDTTEADGGVQGFVAGESVSFED